MIRLEENYRSTQTILDAAAAVVQNNSDRLGKNLQATLGSGDLLRYFEAPDSMAEADFICGEISSIVRNSEDARVAVLYRTGAQSRSFEEVLRRMAIRYRVVGGFSFYERAEVRNALAYVRLLFHPEDDIALLRVLNVPARGIGATTVATLEARARETGQSLWDVIRAGEFSTGKKISGALNYFRETIEALQEECKEMPPAQLIERVLESTGYLDWVEQQDNIEHTSRAENLRELSTAMAEATEQGQTLEDLLDHAALASDSDAYDETIPVSLMTLHSAKGLEFDAVFLAGPGRRASSAQPFIQYECGNGRGAAAFLRGNDAREKIARSFAGDLSPNLWRGPDARFDAVAFRCGDSRRTRLKPRRVRNPSPAKRGVTNPIRNTRKDTDIARPELRMDGRRRRPLHLRSRRKVQRLADADQKIR